MFFWRRRLAGCLCAVLMIGMLAGVGRSSDKVVNPANGHSYMTVAASQITWLQAKEAAEALGGYLVTITSQQEQDFIISSFPEVLVGRWWIGAFQENPPPDSEPAGSWQWVTGEPWSYTNWFAGEPNNDANGENDGMIWHDGYWNDCAGTCDSRGYIVEFESPPPPSVIRPVINNKPGSFPSATNVSARVPVAILTTKAGEYGTAMDFDAAQVVVASVRFGPKAVLDAGGGGVPLHAGHLEDSYELDEVTHDGDLDLVLLFDASDSSITQTTTEACVRGETTGGVQFEACDALKVNSGS